MVHGLLKPSDFIVLDAKENRNGKMDSKMGQDNVNPLLLPPSAFTSPPTNQVQAEEVLSQREEIREIQPHVHQEPETGAHTSTFADPLPTVCSLAGHMRGIVTETRYVTVSIVTLPQISQKGGHRWSQV